MRSSKRIEGNRTDRIDVRINGLTGDGFAYLQQEKDADLELRKG